VLNNEGKIDQKKLDLVSRMGGNWYSRATLGMFEVPKPLSTLGIGVDAIPEYIRLSNVLTGNDLGMLGNIEALPTQEEINSFIAQSVEVRTVLSADDVEQQHKKAQEFLHNNDVLAAWKVLLAK
jgi:hypothetical protein